MTADDEITRFWETAKRHAKLEALPGYFGPSALESLTPPAWAFGADAEQADALLALVLDGTKTATASAYWDYEAEGEALPEAGTMNIVLDGSGHPRALVAITDVRTVAFDDVSEEHAYLEGEDDRTLASWREVHERFFTDNAAHDRGFSNDMPVVLERFQVLYQE